MSDAQKDIVIKVRNLTNAFGPHVVHENLNLDVYRGEVLGLVGGSGTGKSVLMNTILGLRKPQGGSIHVLGHDTQHASTRRGWKTAGGYCFKTARGRRAFGKNCHPPYGKLSSTNKRRVNAIRKQERRQHCP